MDSSSLAIALSLALGAPPAAVGMASFDFDSHHVAGPLTYAEGEIQKIDLRQAKVTLRHGGIENLGLPAMTMVFKLADRRALSGFKPGDAVKFRADRLDGSLQVLELNAR